MKMWNASRFCVSSLRRGHANLLCIVPILVYVLPKQAQLQKKIENNIGMNKAHQCKKNPWFNKFCPHYQSLSKLTFSTILFHIFGCALPLSLVVRCPCLWLCAAPVFGCALPLSLVVRCPCLWLCAAPPLVPPSRSGRPKNIRILRIRIPSNVPEYLDCNGFAAVYRLSAIHDTAPSFTCNNNNLSLD